MTRVQQWIGTRLFKLFLIGAVSAGAVGGFILAAPTMTQPNKASACLPDGNNCGLGWLAANASAKILHAAHQMGAQDRSTAGLNAGPVANPYKGRVIVETRVKPKPKPKPKTCSYEPVASTRITRRPVTNQDGTFGVEITTETVYVSVRVCR